MSLSLIDLIPRGPKVLPIKGTGISLEDQTGAVAFRLEMLLFQPDFQTAQESDAIFGYDGKYIHSLRVGGNTDVLPIDKLSRVVIRPVDSTKTIYVSVVYYTPREDGKS